MGERSGVLRGSRMLDELRDVFGHFGERAMRALAARMTGDDGEKPSAEAASWLARLDDSFTLDPLARALEHPHEQVRINAANALVVEKGYRSPPAFTRALEHPDEDVRFNAVVFLSRVQHANAVEPLLGAARDDSARIRILVVERLGRLGGRRAEEAIRAALEDSSEGVRLEAQQALERRPGTQPAT